MDLGLRDKVAVVTGGRRGSLSRGPFHEKAGEITADLAAYRS